MFKQLRSDAGLLRCVFDLLLTELALCLVSLVPALGWVEHPALAGVTLFPVTVYLLVALIWPTIFFVRSIYAPNNRRAVDEAQNVAVATAYATLILAGLLFFLGPQISRLQILFFAVLDVGLLVASRLAVRLYRRARAQPRYTPRRVLILGAGALGRDVIRMIQKYRWAGLEPVGFLDDEVPIGTEVEGCPVLGVLAGVAQQVASTRADEVVVALPLHSYARFLELLPGLQELPTHVHVIPDHVKSVLFRSRIEEFAGVPMITLDKYGLTALERQVKRALDLVVGSCLFVLASPLLLLTAVVIRLDSPGPVFLRQQRVGEKGQEFAMFKFRSMVDGADERRNEVMVWTEDGDFLFKHRDDPRITRVGRFIRRTSIDELPQLVNVIKGEMSLVGPRPELPWIVEHYEAWQWRRLAVPQGMTGWWQINGRSDKPMHLHTEEDLYYIQNYSLLLDMQIMWKTIGAVVKGQGAY